MARQFRHSGPRTRPPPLRAGTKRAAARRHRSTIGHTPANKLSRRHVAAARATSGRPVPRRHTSNNTTQRHASATRPPLISCTIEPPARAAITQPPATNNKGAATRPRLNPRRAAHQLSATPSNNNTTKARPLGHASTLNPCGAYSSNKS